MPQRSENCENCLCLIQKVLMTSERVFLAAELFSRLFLRRLVSVESSNSIRDSDEHEDCTLKQTTNLIMMEIYRHSRIQGDPQSLFAA